MWVPKGGHQGRFVMGGSTKGVPGWWATKWGAPWGTTKGGSPRAFPQDGSPKGGHQGGSTRGVPNVVTQGRYLTGVPN
jgi:hypothetical protein